MLLAWRLLPKRMIEIHPAQAAHARGWLSLWQGYCAELDGRVSDEATNGLWQRILSPREPIGSLLAFSRECEPVGFANYVLHPHTWSLRPVCYLEDLFVATAARGEGAGRALIEALVTLGREHGWRRVYWHTHENNERARTLYDRLAKRTDYVRYDIEF